MFPTSSEGPPDEVCRLMKRQLGYLLARAQIPLEWLHPHSPREGDLELDGEGEYEEEFPDDIMECLSNVHLSQYFREFGKELGVHEPKSLEDVYKSHLENTSEFCVYHHQHCNVLLLSLGPGTNANVDSARANLAGTFVNAFVNAGFGNDKLMVEAEEGSSWIYKNKEHGGSVNHVLFRPLNTAIGMMSAAASLGLSLLWDTDVGLSQVDKYTYSSEEYIKVWSPFGYRSSKESNCLVRLVLSSLLGF
jgi:26S proteasome regulatory subunit N1